MLLGLYDILIFSSSPASTSSLPVGGSLLEPIIFAYNKVLLLLFLFVVVVFFAR